MRVVIAVAYQIERPLPKMVAINEVEEGQLVQAQDLPTPFETAQIDRAKVRVVRITQKRMVAEESQFVVPRRNLVGRKRQSLPDRVSLITPLEELLETLLEFRIASQ